MTADPVGEYIASLGRDLRAKGIDPMTYRTHVLGRHLPTRRRADILLAASLKRAVRARLRAPGAARSPHWYTRASAAL